MGYCTCSALSTIAMSTTRTIASKHFPILTRTGVFLNHPCHQFEQVMLIKLDHFKNIRSKKSKKTFETTNPSEIPQTWNHETNTAIRQGRKQMLCWERRCQSYQQWCQSTKSQKKQKNLRVSWVCGILRNTFSELLGNVQERGLRRPVFVGVWFPIVVKLLKVFFH